MPSKFPGLPAKCSGGYIDFDKDLRSGITIGGRSGERFAEYGYFIPDLVYSGAI